MFRPGINPGPAKQARPWDPALHTSPPLDHRLWISAPTRYSNIRRVRPPASSILPSALSDYSLRSNYFRRAAIYTFASSAEPPNGHSKGEKHDQHGDNATDHKKKNYNDNHHDNTRHNAVIFTVGAASNASADAVKHNSLSAEPPDGHSKGEKYDKYDDDATDHTCSDNNYDNTHHDLPISSVAPTSNASADVAKHDSSSANTPTAIRSGRSTTRTAMTRRNTTTI